MIGSTAVRLAALLALAPAALIAQQAQVAADGIPTVTLSQAIAMTTRAHPDVIRARGTLDIANNSRRVALASWLPTANISSSVSKSPSTRFNSVTGQIVQVTTPYSGSFGFNANLTLLDGPRFFEGRRTGAQAASAEAALVSQEFSVQLATKQAFFSALAASELERVATTAVQHAQEQLKIAKEKLAAGSAIRSDTLSWTVQHGQAQLQLLNAQAQRATQEATLARLIGFDRPVRALGDSSLMRVVEVDTAAIRAEALRNSPAIAAADASLRSATATVNSARVAYFPTLRASYQNSRSGAAGGFSGAVDFGALNPTWNLSLSLSFPLFNGLQREQTLWNASANRETAEAAAADARRNVNAQVTQWLASLRASRISLSIAQASREAADESLRVQRERYRLGAATIVEVLNAQRALEQSEVDAVNARRDHQVALANLSALLGREL